MRSPRIANEDYDVKAQVGSYIEIDQWSNEGKLLEHDDTEWELCDFRISAGGGLYHLATRIEVTGGTVQRRSHAWNNEWVRVRVILVADPDDIDWYTGERTSEDTMLSGWMLVTDKEKAHNEEKAERHWQQYLARSRTCGG